MNIIIGEDFVLVKFRLNPIRSVLLKRVNRRPLTPDPRCQYPGSRDEQLTSLCLREAGSKFGGVHRRAVVRSLHNGFARMSTVHEIRCLYLQLHRLGEYHFQRSLPLHSVTLYVFIMLYARRETRCWTRACARPLALGRMHACHQ